MPQPFRPVYLGLLTVVAIVVWCVLFDEQIPPNAPVKTRVARSPGQTAWAVDTPSCKIPVLDPYDPSIRAFIETQGPLMCHGVPLLTYIDENGRLRVNPGVHEVYYKHINLQECFYEVFERANENDNDVDYHPKVSLLRNERINGEFVRVTCLEQSDVTVILYRYVHALVVEKPEVEERCQKANSLRSARREYDNFNVIAFGTDSMSRSNTFRQFQKTRQFLLNDLNAIEFYGYNKIGDNTLPNLVALTTGKSENEVVDLSPKPTKSADSVPLILKEYARNGFRTFWAEDYPDVAMFNYLRPGFINQPTDYYWRPFNLAYDRDKSMWVEDCLGPYTETDLILDYVKRFAQKFQKRRHFMFFHLARITHGDVNRASSIDHVYYKFLSDMKTSGSLNNTILIYFSDHGMRFGKLRDTYVGRLEEQLPTLFISFPKWFEDKYPDLVKTVRMNAHRLTTPYDVHEMLVDLLNLKDAKRLARRAPDVSVKDRLLRMFYNPLTYTSESPKLMKHQGGSQTRGVSLFTDISPYRTCTDASIAEQWCTCRPDDVTDLAGDILKETVQFSIDTINFALHIHDRKCAILKLLNITRAYRMDTTDALTVMPESMTYRVTFTTTPGGGKFEATVNYRQNPVKTFTILGDISRLNKYRGQSDCITHARHRLYCFCTTLTTQRRTTRRSLI